MTQSDHMLNRNHALPPRGLEVWPQSTKECIKAAHVKSINNTFFSPTKLSILWLSWSSCLCCSLGLWAVINHKSRDHLSQWATCPFITPGLPLLLLHSPLIPSASMVVSFLTGELCCEFVTVRASAPRSPCPRVSDRAGRARRSCDRRGARRATVQPSQKKNGRLRCKESDR